MIKCKAKTTGSDAQEVDMTLDGSTHEVVCELAAICATVIEEIKPTLKVPMDKFVKNFADMVLAALEEKKNENKEDCV